MKKITLRVLFCLLITSFAYAQTANNDDVLVCYVGGTTFAYPLANDSVTVGNIDYSSLDLDQSLAGIQSSVLIGSVLFTADSSGQITWSETGFGPTMISYTFSDDLGNISNVATLNVYFDPPILASLDFFGDVLAGTTTPSVLLNDLVNGGSAFLVGGVASFVGDYPGFTMSSNGIITIDSGLPGGSYIMNYMASSPVCPYGFTATVNINVIPELSVSATSNYIDYNSDGYVSVGDVIDYQYSVNNASILAMNAVDVTSPLATISGSTIPTLNPGATDSTSFTGRYIITQNDINTGGIISDTVTVTGTASLGTLSNTTIVTNNLTVSNGIKLNAFFDTNNNGVQDVGEVNFNMGQFHYEINSDGIIHSIASSSGMYYLYESNPTTIYNLSYTLDPAFTTYYNLVTAAYPSITVAAASGITTYNFPIIAGTLFNDISVSLMAYNAPPRPGFTYVNRIKYTNLSNQIIPSGTVSFNCGAAVSIITTTPTATTSTTTNFTYDYINLQPFESRYIDVTMQVPTIPTVTLGDLVANTVSIIPTAGDIHPLDNTNDLTQTIVGSYDPNDKTESHGQDVLYTSFTSDDYLTYTIRFENTGTANAVNVRVNDILDAQLDETTIRMIDASHAYVLDRVGTNLNFKFDAIDLPPSIVGTDIGKGYVVFQVKPKSGFAIGDIIPNTANIYFDFNPAIVTNTWTTEFIPLLAVNNFGYDDFIVYPNPVKDILTVESNSLIHIATIYDANGRVMLSSKEKNNLTIFDLKSLGSGIYFLKVTGDNGSETKKIIKQ